MNKIILGDTFKELPNLPDNSIDLVVTSPPYDQMRDYTDGNFIDRVKLGKELFRVCKEGSVCAVVIQDGTSNGAKSLTTARWQVEWADQCGWRLFENCIYSRNGRPGAWWSKRFRVDHEYILIFFKGEKVRFFDKEPLKIPSKHAGVKWHGTTRLTDGSLIKTNDTVLEDTKCRGTIWKYSTSNTEGNKLKMEHPATFPNALASDLIKCFSKENDLVLDPFAGSGTTCVMAAMNKRRYLGIEISEEYKKIAEERLKTEIITSIFE